MIDSTAIPAQIDRLEIAVHTPWPEDAPPYEEACIDRRIADRVKATGYRLEFRYSRSEGRRAGVHITLMWQYGFEEGISPTRLADLVGADHLKVSGNRLARMIRVACEAAQ